MSVDDLSVETPELDVLHLAETIGMKAEPGDEAGRFGVPVYEYFFAVDGDVHLPLADQHFEPVPLMDVAGETREVILFSAEDVFAELSVYCPCAAGQGRGEVHEVALAEDLGHDPGAGGVGEIRRSDAGYEPEIIGVCGYAGGKEGVEIDLWLQQIDVAIEDILLFEAQDTVADGRRGPDVGWEAFVQGLFAVEEPSVRGDADVEGLYYFPVGEELCRMVAGLIIDVGECVFFL